MRWTRCQQPYLEVTVPVGDRPGDRRRGRCELQLLDTGLPLWPGVVGMSWNALLEKQLAIGLGGDDLDRSPQVIAVGVVAMMMRMNDSGDGLACRTQHRSAQLLGVDRRSQAVDQHAVVGADDQSGIGQAGIIDTRTALADEGIDVRGDLPKLRSPVGNPVRTLGDIRR